MTTARHLTVLALALLAGACGKKGPPLPPLEGSVPRVTDLRLRQVGGEIRGEFSLAPRAGTTEVDYATLGIELWRRVAEPSDESTDEELPPRAFREDAELAARIEGEGLFGLMARPRLEIVEPLPRELIGRRLEYALVLRTSERRRGTVSNRVVFVPVAPPEAPSDVTAELTEGAVVVGWTEPPEPEDREGSWGYWVHRGAASRPLSGTPLNEQPVSGPPFSDTDVAVGVDYTYSARTVADLDGRLVASELAPPVEVTYRDAFPPAVPEGLRIIAVGGSVNLVWNPNTEPDLAGYGVYRRTEGGEWVRLDAGRAKTASYTDGTAEAGVAYEYAVSAYDDADPPNESDRSSAEAVTPP